MEVEVSSPAWQTGYSDTEAAVPNPEDVVRSGVVFNHDPSLVRPNSIDLRVKEVYRIEAGISLYADGTRELPRYKRVETVQWVKPPKLGPQRLEQVGDVVEGYTLKPDEFYQVEFMEQFSFPLGLCGMILLRSSMHKSGASGEPGLFDSGYRGGSGISISVKHESFIERGAAIAQMVFLTADAVVAYNGYYTRNNWRRFDTDAQEGVHQGVEKS
ncbi:dCTP deaminase domain-containing protein [Streptomyces sp. CoH17]|uniref:dCTP deaminase domain-containing protein n=1 Tax=Streptomyces sp. CoH17 TaxID=2992806 RepID=UPI003B640DEF